MWGEKWFKWCGLTNRKTPNAENYNDVDENGDNPEKEGDDEDIINNKYEKGDATTDEKKSSNLDDPIKEDDLPAIDWEWKGYTV